MTDRDYVLQAIELAGQSPEEIGCGCVLVQGGTVIAVEYSSQSADQITVHHAEIKALIYANQKLGKRKLEDTVAYCSCEPCAMCLAALSYAKVGRIIYAKTMVDIFPDDPQSQFDSVAFSRGLNFVPKITQLIV